MAPLPTVTIVMPAYNASAHLKKTVPAALAAAARVPGTRFVLVNPGSTDDTAEVAKALGAEVFSLPHRAGPALARNVGVKECDSEVILFIDSDCVAHPDVVERTQQHFAEDPELVSLIGSYDSDPPEKNFFSQYMNLRHHVTHQHANRDRAGFWAGCGAVRLSAFNQVGGFDPERYPMPMIEDIDLGIKLLPLGNCKLDPNMHVTHLKLWTMRGVIETDIKCRAIPWGKLILETGEVPNDLNLRWGQRVSAMLAPFVLGSVVGIPLAVVTGNLPLAAALGVPVTASIVLQRKLLGSMLKLRGLPFTTAFFLFHQVHLMYSAATMAVLFTQHMLTPARQGQV